MLVSLALLYKEKDGHKNIKKYIKYFVSLREFPFGLADSFVLEVKKSFD